MRILFTGHKGFVGVPLSAYLCKKHDVYGFDLVDGKDVRDFDQVLRDSKGMDAIVHLAAIGKPIESKTFADYFMTNVLGTFHICEAAYRNKVKRVVFTSSQARYGFYGGRGYGTSKRICEEMISWYAAGHRTDWRDTDDHGRFTKEPAYFTGVVLRLSGIGSSAEILHDAVDLALCWDKGTYLCIDATATAGWGPYKGEETAAEIRRLLKECSAQQ